MANTFSVTYEIVTEESAADGEAAESGFIGENLSLRAAVADARSSDITTCDDASVYFGGHYVNVNHGRDMYSGECESRTLHFPAGLSASTKRRIARLMGGLK